MKLTMWTRAILASTALIVLASCSDEKNKQKLNPLLQDSQDIISTRPQNSKQMIVILKLKNPALMQVSQKQGVKTMIDATLLEEIQKEQKATIEELAKISSEIRVLYKYKMVLNALAVLIPIEVKEKLNGLGQVAYFETAGTFARPQSVELTNNIQKPIFSDRNSAKFIGAEKLNLQGITGKGMKVGIIDTGIDYTHLMFKGLGTEEAFKAVKPSGEAVGYPNDRVVGGIDFVGTEFDAASPEFTKRIPTPDMNPIDEGGHGTHVAGTVAGLGDGVNSYNGMAPEAVLHAIKVFGAEGSTSDSIVIAALEYSADPNGDGKIDDQLDIVNLSLGSPFGSPRILYSEAIKNLVKGGTVVVASAGNSGHKDYITGAPGSATEAISVAASVDDGEQNWKFNASKIHLGLGDKKESIVVEAIEAASSKKIADAGNVTGKLVDIGLAAEDLTAEQAAALKGHVAFIQRGGGIPFNDKILRASKAGAIGAVLANNADGAAFVMGTKDKFEFPAIMITKADGKKIMDALKNSDANLSHVEIEFSAPEKIEKPELIDTLTGFTSKGPRSIDGFLKPEISAPGNNVISAKMGGGAVAVQMSGTSMAAPHMAGVMALVKQAHPDLSAEELKSIVMGTSTTISEKGERYGVTLQGAGRVQADRAATAQVVAIEPSISFGEVAVESRKILKRTLNFKNLSKEDIKLVMKFEGNEFISMSAASELTLKANQVVAVPMTFTLDASKMKDETIREMDGWVKLMSSAGADGKEVYRVPVLAIAHKLSAVQGQSLKVMASSERDADGALSELVLNNANQNKGDVYLFNLIGTDDRKPSADSYMTSDCDLQSVGYRLVSKRGEGNQSEEVLQVAIKTFKPMTTWNSCDVSLMIDADGDGVAEQELLGSNIKSIPNQLSEEFATTLIDATKARQIRKAFEAEVEKVKNDPVKLEELKTKEKYDEALVDQRELLLFNNSTVVILEAAVNKLAKTKEGNLKFQVILTHNEQSTVQMDDRLFQGTQADLSIALRKDDQAFVDLPEMIQMAGEETKSVDLTKGMAEGSLLLLMPQNKFSTSDLVMDAQAQILKPEFVKP